MYSEPATPRNVSPRLQEVLITRAKQYRQRQIMCAFAVLAVGVLTVGIYGTFYLKTNSDKVSRTAVETEFRISSLGVAEIVEVTSLDAMNLLTMLSGTFRQFPRLAFRQFVDIVSPLRGVDHQQAVQWIPKTSHSERAQLEAEISAYVGRNLSIMELATNNTLVPRTVQDVYFPVAYCDPVEGNERILLFDDTSSPERFEALMTSLEQATPVMTPPITLLQAVDGPGMNIGALVFVPTYNSSCGNVSLLSATQRYECALGLVLGVWRYDVLLSGYLQAVGHAGTTLHILDVEADHCVYRGTVTAPGVVEAQHPHKITLNDKDLYVSKTVYLADREFLIVVKANPDFTTYVPGYPAGDTELGLGIALTVIVLCMVWTASWCWLQQDRKRDQYAQQQLERSTIKAARDTNNRIVGYICHELRNPLHVLETWFGMFFSNVVKPVTPVGKNAPHSASLQSVTSTAASVASVDANQPFAHLSHEDVVTATQDIGNALAQMRCIVNDVLDYRALDAGGLTFQPKPVSIARSLLPTIRRSAAFLQPGVELRYSLPPDGIWAVVDAQRLTQIITNGISNAGKFTKDGYVSVTVSLVTACPERTGDVLVAVCTPASRDGRQADSQWLVLDIANSGTGLSYEPEQYFIPFKGKGMDGRHLWATGQHRSEDTSLRQLHDMWTSTLMNPNRSYTVIGDGGNSGGLGPVTASTGLGLPLSREFANVCGGWLGLEDDPAGITHFWCVVPAPSHVRGNSRETMYASELDTQHSDGEACLSSAVSVCSLPQPSGEPKFEVRITGTMAGSNSSPQLPITESSLPHVVPTLSSPGPEQSKSLSIHELRLPPLNPPQHAPSVASQASCSVLEQLHVVVVDDEAANRRVAERLLIKAGIPRANITLLDSGEAALVHLTDAVQKPDIVLLDIQMGKVSGLDVVRALASRGDMLEQPAIVACTSYVTTEDKVGFEFLVAPKSRCFRRRCPQPSPRMESFSSASSNGSPLRIQPVEPGAYSCPICNLLSPTQHTCMVCGTPRQSPLKIAEQMVKSVENDAVLSKSGQLAALTQASRPSSSDKQSGQTAPVTPKSAGISRHVSPTTAMSPHDQWTDPLWPSHRELWPHAALSCQPVSRSWPWDDATDSGTSTDIDLSVATPHGRGRLAWSLYTITMHLKQRTMAQKRLAGEELTVELIRDAMLCAEDAAPHHSRSFLKRKRSLQPDQLAQLLAEKSRVINAVKNGKIVLETPADSVTPYVDQGNLEMYSLENLMRRDLLRRNKGIRKWIQKFWILCRSGGPDPYFIVTPAVYTTLLSHFHRVLRPECSVDDILTAIQKDWGRDSNGQVCLDEHLFFNALFEVADVWCYGLRSTEYVDVLGLLWKCVCITCADGTQRLRAMNESGYDVEDFRRRFCNILSKGPLDVYSDIRAGEQVFAAPPLTIEPDSPAPSVSTKRTKSPEKSPNPFGAPSPPKASSPKFKTPLRHRSVQYGRAGMSTVRRNTDLKPKSPSRPATSPKRPSHISSRGKRESNVVQPVFEDGLKTWSPKRGNEVAATDIEAGTEFTEGPYLPLSVVDPLTGLTQEDVVAMAMAALAEGSVSTLPSGSVSSSRPQSPTHDARRVVFPTGPQLHRILTTAEDGYAPLSPFNGAPTSDASVDLSFRRYAAVDSKGSLDSVPPPPPTQAFDVAPASIDLQRVPVKDVRMVGKSGWRVGLRRSWLGLPQRVRSMSVDAVSTCVVKRQSRKVQGDRVQHRVENGKAVSFVGYLYHRKSAQWRPLTVSRTQIHLGKDAVSALPVSTRPLSRHGKRAASLHSFPALQYSVAEVVTKSPAVSSPIPDVVAISGSIPSGHSYEGLSESEPSTKAQDRNARYLKSAEGFPGHGGEFEFSVDSSGGGDDAAAGPREEAETSTGVRSQSRKPSRKQSRRQRGSIQSQPTAPHVYVRPSSQQQPHLSSIVRPASPVDLSLNARKDNTASHTARASGNTLQSPLQQRKIVTGFAGTVHPGGSSIPTVASVASLSVVGSPEAGQLSHRTSRVSMSVESQSSLKPSPSVVTETSLSPDIMSAAASEHDLLAGEVISAPGSPAPTRDGKLGYRSPAVPSVHAPVMTSPRSGRYVSVDSSLLKKQSLRSSSVSTPKPSALPLPTQVHPSLLVSPLPPESPRERLNSHHETMTSPIVVPRLDSVRKSSPFTTTPLSSVPFPPISPSRSQYQPQPLDSLVNDYIPDSEDLSTLSSLPSLQSPRQHVQSMYRPAQLFQYDRTVASAGQFNLNATLPSSIDIKFPVIEGQVESHQPVSSKTVPPMSPTPRNTWWESSLEPANSAKDSKAASPRPKQPVVSKGTGIVVKTDPTLESALRFLKSHANAGGVATDRDRFQVSGSLSPAFVANSKPQSPLRKRVNQDSPVQFEDRPISPPAEITTHPSPPDTAPPLIDLFNCSIDWFIRVDKSGTRHRVTSKQLLASGARKVITLPPQEHHPSDSDGDQHSVMLQSICLRSRHSWFEMDGFLAVHYIDGHALGSYDVTSGRFVDDSHIMWLPGVGWVKCLLDKPLSSASGSDSEAFGVRCRFPHRRRL